MTEYGYDDDLEENISTRLSLFEDDSLEFQPLGGAVDEFISFAQHPEKRVWTGIEEIDAAMRGIAPGEFCQINGFAHNGKTLLVVEFLLKNEGRPGIVFSPDETRVLVLIKLAAAVLAISAEEMERRVNQEDPEAIELLNDIANRFSNLAVFEDPVNIHGMDRAYQSTKRAIGEPEFVVFDFADLLDEDVDLPAKLRLLKMFGKDHSVPMIVLVQSSKSMGGGGKSVTIESGSHDRGDSATFIIGVRRKINMLKDHVRQLEEKLEQTMNPTQAEKIIDKIRDIQQDMIPRHRDTITINLVKNKRPPSRLVEEVDFKLDSETGRLTPIVKLPDEEPDLPLPMIYSTGKSARDLLAERESQQ